MAEALGRLILQDPTFVCVLNDEETSNTEVTQVENETSNEQGDVELSNGNKDKRDELRSQGLGVWSYSSKYPNLQVYFCYITARSKEEHANMLNENSSRIHNVLLTCKEHLPVILQEKIDKKSQ